MRLKKIESGEQLNGMSVRVMRVTDKIENLSCGTQEFIQIRVQLGSQSLDYNLGEPEATQLLQMLQAALE